MVITANPAGPFVAGQFGYIKLVVRNKPTVGGGAGAGVLSRRLGEVGPAVDPIVTISVPAGVTVSSSSAWSCGMNGSAITCQLPTLQPGDMTEAQLELSLPDTLPAAMAVTTSITSTGGPTFAGESRSFSVGPASGVSYARLMAGGLAVAGNSVLTCTDNDQCAEAQLGTANGFKNARHGHRMDEVDVDGDVDTFNSAAAMLEVPAGATVEYALLTWSGDTNAGDGGAEARDPAARNFVRFGTPAGWLALTADEVRTPGGTSAAYYATADVTDVVSGSGRYWIADLQTGTGKGVGGGRGRFGGWSLIVAYRDPAKPMAYVTVMDQYTTVDNGPTTISVDLAGLPARAGTRATTLAWLASEGDRSLGGEVATVNGQQLTNGDNPVGDVFNSTIAGGARDPGHPNTLGIDADIFALSLPAGDAAMTLSLQSPSDLVRLGAIGLVVEL